MKTIKKLFWQAYWWLASLKTDKRAHFDVGYNAGIFTLLILMTLSTLSPWIPLIPVITVSIIAGIIKEVYDKYYGTGYDLDDVMATIQGGIAATIVQYVYVILNQIVQVYLFKEV